MFELESMSKKHSKIIDSALAEEVAKKEDARWDRVEKEKKRRFGQVFSFLLIWCYDLPGSLALIGVFVIICVPFGNAMFCLLSYITT